MKKIIITENDVNVSGFSADDFTGYAKKEFSSCRDVARVGLAWAAKRIAEELHKDLIGEWDKQTTYIGD